MYHDIRLQYFSKAQHDKYIALIILIIVIQIYESLLVAYSQTQYNAMLYPFSKLSNIAFPLISSTMA